MTKRIYRITATCGGVYRIRATSRREAESIARDVESFGWTPQEQAPLS